MADDKNYDDQVSNLMREKVREVKAEGLSGNVKVLSRRALMDIVDKLIKAYGGLEHEELLSKITEYELMNKQLETKLATLQGKVETYESQLGELRKEDDDLRAKLKSDEGRLPMLEEQNEVLKKTVSGLEAEIENIKNTYGKSEAEAKEALDKATREAEELKARLAETEPRIEAAENARAEAEKRLQAQQDTVNHLEDRIHEVQSEKEKALADSREKVARLERSLQESDARKRILELENEVSDLTSSLEVLDLGLEFVDLGPAPRFEEAEVELGAVDDMLGGVAAEDAEVQAVRDARDAARNVLEADREAFPRLAEQMYDNKGSIPVACELAKILVRQADLMDGLKVLKTAAGLLS